MNDDYFDDLDDAISARDDKHAELDRDDIIDEDMSTGYIRGKAARKMQKQVEDDSMFGDDDIALANQIAQAPGGTEIDPSSAQPVMSLQGKVGLRDEKKRRLIEEAKFVRVNPSSVLRGIGGNQANIYPGGPAIQVVNWGGEDAETLPITITVAPTTPANFAFIPTHGGGAGVGGLRPYAIVQFGTKGMMARAKVDIGQGAQFTVSGSSVVVQVGSDIMFGNNVGGVPTQVLPAFPYMGMISYYPIVRTAPLTCTVYLDTQNPSGVDLPFATAVPAFAKNVVICGNGLLGGAPTFNVYDSQFAVCCVLKGNADGTPTQSVELPNDATYIETRTFVGPGGGLVASVRFIFGLSI